MVYYIQRFAQGAIYRNGNIYELNIDGKVVGSYCSVAELVKASSKPDGVQATETTEQNTLPEADTATDAMIDECPAKEATPKKSKKARNSN